MITHCGQFDTTLNLTTDPCGSNDIAPNAGYDAGISTVQKKFGVGSLTGDSVSFPGFIDITWSSLTNLPGNEGSIEFWFRPDVSDSDFNDIVINIKAPSWKNSYIFIEFDFDPGGSNLDVSMSMRDSGGTTRVSISQLIAVVPTTKWYHCAVNWLWNSGGGKTEIAIDGTVYGISTGGNNFSRDGSATNALTIDGFAKVHGPEVPYLDDFTIWDVRQHIGNFIPPTVAQCICDTPSLQRYFRLGSPMGFNRMH